MEKGDPVQLANFQQELRPDELVLEYALGESTSYVLVIDNSEIRVVRLPDRARIEGIVDQYLAEIRARKAATELGQQLYSILLGSIPEYLRKPRLIVVPDGKLNLVPFDALVNNKGDYVLSSHAVTSAPSATVLHLLRSRPERTGMSVPLLAVGDVSYVGEGGTPRLTGALPNCRRLQLEGCTT